MSTIIAIGGGELGNLETLPIDREIIKYSRKKHPKVLFMPIASKDAVGYWEVFQSVYKDKLKCKTDVLYLLNGELSKQQIEEKYCRFNRCAFIKGWTTILDFGRNYKIVIF